MEKRTEAEKDWILELECEGFKVYKTTSNEVRFVYDKMEDVEEQDKNRKPPFIEFSNENFYLMNEKHKEDMYKRLDLLADKLNEIYTQTKLTNGTVKRHENAIMCLIPEKFKEQEVDIKANTKASYIAYGALLLLNAAIMISIQMFW